MTQLSAIRNEKGEIIIKTDFTEIQKTISNYFENLYYNKLETLKEMVRALDTYELRKLIQTII